MTTVVGLALEHAGRRPTRGQIAEPGTLTVISEPFGSYAGGGSSLGLAGHNYVITGRAAPLRLVEAQL